jgi:hypothetical protein
VQKRLQVHGQGIHYRVGVVQQNTVVHKCTIALTTAQLYTSGRDYFERRARGAQALF